MGRPGCGGHTVSAAEASQGRDAQPHQPRGTGTTGASVGPLTCRPLKQTLQSKKQIPAKVQVGRRCYHRLHGPGKNEARHNTARVAGGQQRRGLGQALLAPTLWLQVKVPKALFEVAVASGNAPLVERSVKQDASRAALLHGGFKLPLRPQPGSPSAMPSSSGPFLSAGPSVVASSGFPYAAPSHATLSGSPNGSAAALPAAGLAPVASTATVARRVPTCEYFFDPSSASDVFPQRAVEGSALADYLASSAAAAELTNAEPGHPLGWVPSEEGELGTRLRPRTGQLPTRTTTTMPLEYFDSPEMELTPPEERLAAGGGAGVPAFSRYFDSAGSFTWAPCTATEYDRCGRPSAGEGASTQLVGARTGSEQRRRDPGGGGVVGYGAWLAGRVVMAACRAGGAQGARHVPHRVGRHRQDQVGQAPEPALLGREQDGLRVPAASGAAAARGGAAGS